MNSDRTTLLLRFLKSFFLNSWNSLKMLLNFKEFPSIIIFCCFDFLDLLGMDESKRSGRSTRKALRDFTLMPSICSTAKSEENKLEKYVMQCSPQLVLFNPYPIMTIVKSRIFHVLRRYAFWCDIKPYAMIFIQHSLVKITVKIISISSCNVTILLPHL